SGVSGLVEASAVRISPLASALEFGVQLGFGHGLACIHVNLYPVIREAVEDGVSILVEVFCSGFDRGRLVLVGKLDPDAVLGDTAVHSDSRHRLTLVDLLVLGRHTVTTEAETQMLYGAVINDRYTGLPHTAKRTVNRCAVCLKGEHTGFFGLCEDGNLLIGGTGGSSLLKLPVEQLWRSCALRVGAGGDSDQQDTGHCRHSAQVHDATPCPSPTA